MQFQIILQFKNNNNNNNNNNDNNNNINNNNNNNDKKKKKKKKKKKFEFDHANTWYMHNPAPVLENDINSYRTLEIY